jgi:hypothetical protein
MARWVFREPAGIRDVRLIVIGMFLLINAYAGFFDPPADLLSGDKKPPYVRIVFLFPR